MGLLDEIMKNVRLEIRANSKEREYLEAVIEKSELESLQSILTKHLGLAAKEPGKKGKIPKKIQGIVDMLGGLRIQQSFFYREEGTRVTYTALWPWESNPERITIKSGIIEL
jgi:hypothetical protein